MSVCVWVSWCVFGFVSWWRKLFLLSLNILSHSYQVIKKIILDPLLCELGIRFNPQVQQDEVRWSVSLVNQICSGRHLTGVSACLPNSVSLPDILSVLCAGSTVPSQDGIIYWLIFTHQISQLLLITLSVGFYCLLALPMDFSSCLIFSWKKFLFVGIDLPHPLWEMEITSALWVL